MRVPRAALGIEPRTSRTLSENHTTRPSSRLTRFCLFIHGQEQIQRSIVVATCRTHRRHSHSASIITTLGGWIGAAEVCKVHSAGTSTSHKVSSLQIHDRTQTRQTQLHAATPWLGLKLKRTSLCALRGLLWELNPGPLAPEARIIPLDQAAD